ncbi:MAG TPA: potassium-transporting ATPase subunit KdpB [Myxococcota bacterium]|nr:potassium-transporting ATPase subunit KdpB [Myxococcota bacterium]
MVKKAINVVDRAIIRNSIKDAFNKLDPRVMIKNPVMFVTWVGALICTFSACQGIITANPSGFDIQITIWLWFTVIFANFAEALAEGRGKAQAESLKKGKATLTARQLIDGKLEIVPATGLRVGDRVVCEASDIIPADGEVIEGIASVDESAITGESAPVIRESGGDRSAVTGGTKVISDRLVIRVTADPGNTFLDRIISLIENAKRQKTPNELALTIVLTAFSIILLFAVATLKFFADYSAAQAQQDLSDIVTVPVLISLLVCLIPTTIGGLLSAIGIAGMDRLIRKNVIAKSGKAIEAAGDIDILLIDKTGTITLGNRMAVAFIPTHGCTVKKLAEAAQLASLADETPEGRSIVVLAKEEFQMRAQNLHASEARFVPFSAETRMSGIDLLDKDGNTVSSIRKGAMDAINALANGSGAKIPADLKEASDKICAYGGTPLAVIKDKEVLGIIHLKDMVKGGIKEKFHELHLMGIKTIMITGDNPMTAAAIAAEAGVDDFIAEATPESKLLRIREEQRQGHLVAMTGDGTNDAPALAQADVGVAMNTGTQAAREAGNLVDLDSNPTKVIEIVETGKQLLMTRGSLTTFSIANDLAKYFAILPAIFINLYATAGMTNGPLSQINVMYLASPKSAILSAVIFNALIIVFLIPLALKGVAFKARSASVVLKRNLLIYGLGGIVLPFVGIKLIDIVIVFLGLAT